MCRVGPICTALFISAIVTAASADVVWDDDFSQFDPSRYYTQEYEGNPQMAAYWDSIGGYFVITGAVGSTGARVFFLSRQLTDQWYAEFDYRVGGGSGADGFTFAFCGQYDYASGSGSVLDFWPGADGYAVEFDTYPNNGIYVYDPTSQDHIAFVKNTTANHLYWVTPGRIDDNLWHHAVVEFQSGSILVSIDGVEVMRYQDPAYTPFPGYFGFTASTGSATNWHIIDNVRVSVPGEVATSPTTWGSIKSLYR